MHEKLNHDLIALNGKKPDDVVAERHELVLLFDCEKSNPNGDPDTGNMPRIQPDTLKGLVTDVCLKRKIRNFFGLNKPDGTPIGDKPEEMYAVFIRENAILQQVMESPAIEALAKAIFEKDFGQKPEAWDARKKARKAKAKAEETRPEDPQKEEEVSPADDFKKQAYRAALLRTFFDLRTFGGVISTEGPLKGSFYGQVRGPVQITFSESLDKVLQLDATITRCAVASVKEKKQTEDSESGDNRTMGRKHGIDYGLYRCSIHISPAFAGKTDFSYYDLDNFFFAMKNMFVDDHAAGRHLRLVGLVDFQHTSSLGNAPAHKLFEMVNVEGIKEDKDGRKVFKSSGSEFPQGLYDYHGSAPGGVEHYEPVPGFEPKNGEKNARVTARKLVWEIPEIQG
ncbi:MAG: type I-C CRISPR-associated protein Cas7/Csd2 [Verrucomicrobia bacterium]|nr:type I-C CRISPR-associated protein Cas7/Csd2 [Verrucomicrobiota bacterium]MBU4429287.1 type I-C CRISPR-associated protein Cas7/Csd2 [Verrucomicrobiota bacterium]MBU4497588.1 type I-C CRISPR-associated protein Cas7/Csd2 [Verrucomicrobiota bacterium]MCG2680746.1 type I-C CRISPR-associated protein Cas7/Csd2 [Kiritimatiellia bacterium]